MATIITLNGAYPSRFGAPVITGVHPDIFRLRYFTHCMRCQTCFDACCRDGVDIDVENVARILTHAEALEPLVGRPASEWFSPERRPDAEFPGGASTRTAVVDGGCVFLSRGGRGCLLHRYALHHDIDYHELKPLVSALFPVTFDDGVLHAADEVISGELVCSGAGPTLYEGVRGELAYYFGSTLVDELDRLPPARR
jgi:hypothetical protein